MLSQIRELLTEHNLDGILINSTNEFLVEYNSLEENSRYKLTGFSGSTGDAVVTKDKIYLFVDGRYHIQADNEVDKNIVTVEKLQTGETFQKRLNTILPTKKTLGVFAAKNSVSRVEKLKEDYNIVLLDNDPCDKKISKDNCITEQIPIELCGVSTDEKLKELRKLIDKSDAILITNLEEVSYIFNMRDFSKPYAANIPKRAIITQTSAELFDRDEFIAYKKSLENIKGKIYFSKNMTNARDYEIIKEKAACLKNNPIAEMKSIKNKTEIEHYKNAFANTDLAMKAIRNFINENDNISEYDIAEKLEYYFKKYGAKSLSFKSIVAKDKNSALAHYSKCSKDEIIKDGSLVLIDCGAYYEGGLATDITRVFVKGEPDKLQKKIYTTVLKSFLLGFNHKMTSETTGFEIDKSVREFLTAANTGFEFNHGLGHGIGISVHEYPPNLSCNELAKVTLKDGMCFTIEPGLYNKDHFGIRLENSCYLMNGKFHSFVKMNYEKKLIDYSLLNDKEKEWLEEFEVI